MNAKIIFVGLLLSAPLFAQPAATPASSKYCSCSDLNNIGNRIFDVEHYVSKFTDAYNDPTNATTPWTFSRWKNISESIGSTIANLDNPYNTTYNASLAQGDTKYDCTPNLPDPKDVPPCIMQSLREHEKIHAKACKKYNGNTFLPITPLYKWQNAQTIKDAAEEDAKAYGAEVKFLKEQQHQLKCTCPYYALEMNGQTDVLFNNGMVNLNAQNALQAKGQPGVTMPLTYNADGTVHAEGKGQQNGNTQAVAMGQTVVVGTGQTMTLVGDGSVDGPERSTTLTMNFASDTGNTQHQAASSIHFSGAWTGNGTGVVTPAGATVVSNGKSAGQGETLLSYSMPAVVGGSQAQPIPLGPVAQGNADIKIVETPMKAKLTQDMHTTAKNMKYTGDLLNPDTLPNCKTTP